MEKARSVQRHASYSSWMPAPPQAKSGGRRGQAALGQDERARIARGRHGIRRGRRTDSGVMQHVPSGAPHHSLQGFFREDPEVRIVVVELVLFDQVGNRQIAEISFAVGAERGDTGAQKNIARGARQRLQHQERILQVVQHAQHHGESVVGGRQMRPRIQIDGVNADGGFQFLFERVDAQKRVVIGGRVVDRRRPRTPRVSRKKAMSPSPQPTSSTRSRPIMLISAVLSPWRNLSSTSIWPRDRHGYQVTRGSSGVSDFTAARRSWNRLACSRSVNVLVAGKFSS